MAERSAAPQFVSSVTVGRTSEGQLHILVGDSTATPLVLDLLRSAVTIIEHDRLAQVIVNRLLQESARMEEEARIVAPSGDPLRKVDISRRG